MSQPTPPQPDDHGTPPAYRPPPAPPSASTPGQPPYGAAPAQPPYGAPALPPYGASAQPPYGQPSYAPPAYPQQPYGQSSPYGQNAPYGQAAPYGYGYAPAAKTNPLSIVSLVLSILGFIWVLPLIGSLGGAIVGHFALKQIARDGTQGRGMALAGVIVGWAGVGITVLIGLVMGFAIFGSLSYGTYS
jgi:hypothetical protein